MAVRPACRSLRTEARRSRVSFATSEDRNSQRTRRALNTSAGKIGATIRPAIRNSDSLSTTRNSFSLCGLWMASSAATSADFLERPASWRGTCLRVAPTGEKFVDRDHRGASDDGDGRQHENSFGHDSLPADFNANTPEESCSRKTRELRGRAISSSWDARTHVPTLRFP